MNHVRRVLTALPLLAGAALYIAALQGVFVRGVTKEELELGFFFEFVAIHSVPFAAGFLVFKPSTWRGHLGRWAGLLALLGMYTLFPWFEAGLNGVLMFWAFAVGTYLGPLLHRERLRGLMTRWGVNFVLYILVMCIVQSATDFSGDNFAEVPVRTQFIFLATLLAAIAALEITGVYDHVLARNAPREQEKRRALEPVA